MTRSWRSITADDIIEIFALLGRWLLIIMYFYGVFHKINYDFLDPETSCAVWLWRRYNFPSILSNSHLIHLATIYGTLIVELVVAGLLLSKRYRYWGILIGVGFHGFLGLLPPGYIRAFSLLSIILHSLFLPRDTWARFCESRLWWYFTRYVSNIPRRIGLGLVVLAIYLALPRGIAWIGLIAGIWFFFVCYARDDSSAEPRRVALVSPSLLINILAIAFFVNGMLPYFGLKTGQSIGMFSNRVTEAGNWNHIINA